MTKKKFYVGTLAIALVFALMLAGCDNGTTSGTGTSDGKTTLKADVWANGKIASSSGKQWFTFTATADTQYIHVNFGTITELYIQLYDSEDEPVGDEINLSRSKTYFSTEVTTGEVYSIKVCPGPSTAGTYQITFNDSATGPLITLTANVWANGNIPTSSGEQWFKFTANAETQYIYASFGTLTDLYIQLYDKDGNTVGGQTNLDNFSSYTQRTLTIGQVYRIKVTPYGSYSGTYQIAFNNSRTVPPITLPSNAIQLSANVWADGNISASSGEQWFKFTANADLLQYIHINFKTLTSLYIRLYDNKGSTVGSQTNLSTSGDKYTTQPLLTKGQVYYIKVTPRYSSGTNSSGTYQIAFNTTETSPPAALPSNAIQIPPNVFVDGFIPESDSEQWFKFTATAEVQYIHAGFETLTSLYIQLYNSGGHTVGGLTNLYSTSTYVSRPLTTGQVYYIKVTPRYSSGTNSSGTYQIGFNTSTTAPTRIVLPTDAVQLTVNVSSDGNITESNRVEWFKFTATAETQYIHAGFGSLTNLYIQLYDSEGNTAGNRANLYGSTAYVSRSLTVEEEYYIRVTPYSSSDTGTYRIGFNTSTAVPLPANAIQLTVNVFSDGNIPTTGGEQWFKFTAIAATQYIHITFGTLTNLYVQLYTNEGNTVGNRTELYSSTTYAQRTGLTAGQEYYIRVTPYGTYGAGTYQIAFNSSSAAPPSSVTPLTAANVWTDGNISTASGEQWFKFTATAVSHYIHVGFGTLNNMYVQLYDSENTTVGERTRLSGSTTYILRASLTVGKEYYIRITPYSSSGIYQIGFNESATPPPITLPATATELTLNIRSDGNISTAGGEEWFKFSATAGSHYIHVDFGTLDDLFIQLYTSDGYTTGEQTNLYGSTTYIIRGSLTTGEEYYIKVLPDSNGTGAYQIGFNTSTVPPPITLPANAIQLTLNTRSDGNIPTAGGEQWFKFTATATSHYIHAGFGTLTRLYIQLYDNEGNTVGERTNLYSYTTYAQQTGLTIAQEYHIKVTPYNSSGNNSSGTYEIGFNTSTAALPITLPTNATQLTLNVRSDGNISIAGGEQWFKFTATAGTHYIHAGFGTLTSLYIQLYDNGGSTVGERTNLYSYTTYAQRTGLTIGQEYHIKVTPRYSSGTDSSGTYEIGFNTSTTALPITLPTNAIQLTATEWAEGNIPTAGGEQWFKFTATAASHYIHANFGTLDDLYVQLYDNGGNAVGVRTELYSTTYTSRTDLTAGQEYHIKVTPWSTRTGTYRIAFNTSTTAP